MKKTLLTMFALAALAASAQQQPANTLMSGDKGESPRPLRDFYFTGASD